MTTLLSTAVIAALVAACGTNGGGDGIRESTNQQEPASHASTDMQATPTTAHPKKDPTDAVPAFPENTADQTEEGSGGRGLVLMDVRVAGHENFDRIVLEFSGTGIPGWTVSYAEQAVLDGSGEVVTLRGDAILDIYASGTTWPASDYYSGARQFEPVNGGDIHDVYVGGTFEGYTQVLAGMHGGPVPFRVFALTDPSRLVVDVEGSVD